MSRPPVSTSKWKKVRARSPRFAPVILKARFSADYEFKAARDAARAQRR